MKRTLLIADYIISKFPTVFEYQKKDLEKFILSLKKRRNEYILIHGTNKMKHYYHQNKFF